jgi:hypothetical protein
MLEDDGFWQISSSALYILFWLNLTFKEAVKNEHDANANAALLSQPKSALFWTCVSNAFKNLSKQVFGARYAKISLNAK